MTNDTSVQYAGFWRRFAATLIDSLLIVLVMLPILLAIYGAEYFEGGAEIKSGWDLLMKLITSKRRFSRWYLFKGTAIRLTKVVRLY